jgi:hypothetical protein
VAEGTGRLLTFGEWGGGRPSALSGPRRPRTGGTRAPAQLGGWGRPRPGLTARSRTWKRVRPRSHPQTRAGSGRAKRPRPSPLDACYLGIDKESDAVNVERRARRDRAGIGEPRNRLGRAVTTSLRAGVSSPARRPCVNPVAKRIAAGAGERCLACAHAAPASLQRTALGVEALVALRDVSESAVAVHGPWDSPPGEAPPPLAGCTSRRARPVSGDTADRFAATWRGRRTGRSRAPSRGTRAPTRGRTAARGAGSARSAPSARGRGPAGPWTKAGRSHPHGPQASATTKAMLPPGTRVRLFPEPATDSVDQYGRLLRYVVRAEDGLNVMLRAAGDRFPGSFVHSSAEVGTVPDLSLRKAFASPAVAGAPPSGRATHRRRAERRSAANRALREMKRSFGAIGGCPEARRFRSARDQGSANPAPAVRRLPLRGRGRVALPGRAAKMPC